MYILSKFDTVLLNFPKESVQYDFVKLFDFLLCKKKEEKQMIIILLSCYGEYQQYHKSNNKNREYFQAFCFYLPTSNVGT